MRSAENAENDNGCNTDNRKRKKNRKTTNHKPWLIAKTAHETIIAAFEQCPISKNTTWLL